MDKNEKCKRGFVYAELFDFVDFQLLLGSPDDHFGSIWRSLGTILATFCNQVAHRCTQRDLGRSQGGILMLFDGFLGLPPETILDHFLIFPDIWGIKNHVWIAGMMFDDLSMEKMLIYDVPTYQKYSK